MIHKYNNTQSNKIINHPIHEQKIYNKIIILLTSKLLHTNSGSQYMACFVAPEANVVYLQSLVEVYHLCARRTT
jgi:hypothetical protein